MIEINNLTANQVDKEFLREVAKKVLISENKERLELSIVLVGQARIRELNKKYRKINKPTDVLSFNYDNTGEIVICPSQIKENAKEYKSTYEKELAKVLIHGALHLLGYDHEKGEKEARKMEEKQKYYLKKFF
ncbi:MAG: rRNA maturation RNase YbeY [bacterium]|nr:rRNA maturation RNase YbeY [bacterium]